LSPLADYISPIESSILKEALFMPSISAMHGKISLGSLYYWFHSDILEFIASIKKNFVS
jgi:hypothetical protein